jgi:L-arabinonolactonase
VQSRSLVPEVIGNARALLGESPWWDGVRLSWVDILGRTLNILDLASGESAIHPTPGTPGFAIPEQGGGWAVGLGDGLYSFSPEQSEWRQTWTAPHDPTTHRMNDAKTDSWGRLWMGSMTYEEREPVGALYRSDAGHVEEVLAGIITSNGLGWSPDDRTFYFTDSIARLIWSFDVDPESVVLKNRRVFAQDPSGYVPDGLAVDDEGCVWSCKWDGGRIVRYSPEGCVLRELAVPVARPTSCAFVGGDRSTLAVTTALPPEARRAELDGAVLLYDVGVSGPQLAPVAVQVPDVARRVHQ